MDTEPKSNITQNEKMKKKLEEAEWKGGINKDRRRQKDRKVSVVNLHQSMEISHIKMDVITNMERIQKF